jgi:hypothetical protein
MFVGLVLIRDFLFVDKCFGICSFNDSFKDNIKRSSSLLSIPDR